MPATVDALRTHLGLDPASTVDEAAMTQDVDAANATAVALRRDVTTDPETGAILPDWSADLDMGAVLLAARLYGRRGSVAGVAGFADAGVMLLARLDPDVRLLWGLGEYQRSVIA